MPIETLLLSIPDAALSLRVSRSTIYRLIESGDIETISVRGLTRIRARALEKYLDNQQRKTRERLVNF